MSGTLYIVATPIGNLEDLSFRALNTLKSVGLIAAEDTRVTKKILSHFNFSTPIISFNENNSLKRTPKIIKTLSEKNVALVSDAGTPLISDPGRVLVQAVKDSGFNVSPIPGPSSVTASISVAAIKSPAFIFVGFLPRNAKARVSFFDSVKRKKEAIVFFESPHRLISTLQIISEASREASLTICRELTKFHEEIWQGRPYDALEHFKKPIGEFVLIFEPSPQDLNKKEPSADELVAHLSELKAVGLSRNEASVILAKQLNMPKREIYKHWQKEN